MSVLQTIDFEKSKVWRTFTINVSLIIVLFLAGIFIGFVFRTNRIIQDQILTTARAHFRNIVLTRRWNANLGGVYVKKGHGVESNPYLENPDIITTDGAVYTMKNPALMTREISEYAKKAGDFTYHITSLNPLNPGNAADDFETGALRKFETGIKEASASVKTGDRSTFRYMAPLSVEESCMACHAKQGYHVGDVRGGISVSFDTTEVEKKLAANRRLVAILSVATVSALLAIIFFMVSRLARRLTAAYQTIERMSVTDELTQVYNRRYFHTRLDEEISRSKRYGHPLSLLMLDIDHFKRVNDDFGHQVGDDVLTSVAAIVTQATRKADIVARYGGEEMAVILPETDAKGAASSAEKIRQAIEMLTFDLPDENAFGVTAGLGVSQLIPGEESVDAGAEAKNLIKRADDALYRAKEGGRNRVVEAI